MSGRRVAWVGAAVGAAALAGGGAPFPPRGPGGTDAARLSTAMMRCDRLDRGAADLVRAIERSDDFERSRDNALIADLTAFRVYVRSLNEVAEQARGEMGGRGSVLRYRTAVGAMRRLALRLRVTAANVESELSLERPAMADDWNRLVRDNLEDVVQTVLGLQTIAPPPPPPPDDTGRPPPGFVRIPKLETYKPSTLAGRASHVKIETYGGNIKVRTVRFTVTEVAFDYFKLERSREVRVNRDVVPGSPLLVEAVRGGEAVDVSKIEIEWEPDGRHICFGRVTLVQQ